MSNGQKAHDFRYDFLLKSIRNFQFKTGTCFSLISHVIRKKKADYLSLDSTKKTTTLTHSLT